MWNKQFDQLLELLESGGSRTLKSHAWQSMKTHCLCPLRNRRNCDDKENWESIKFESMSEWMNPAEQFNCSFDQASQNLGASWFLLGTVGNGNLVLQARLDSSFNTLLISTQFLQLLRSVRTRHLNVRTAPFQKIEVPTLFMSTGMTS